MICAGAISRLSSSRRSKEFDGALYFISKLAISTKKFDAAIHAGKQLAFENYIGRASIWKQKLFNRHTGGETNDKQWQKNPVVV